MNDPSNHLSANGLSGEEARVEIPPEMGLTDEAPADEALGPLEDEPWQPIPVLLVFGCFLTMAGAMLVGSPPSPQTQEAVSWRGGSILKPICELLALNYNHPTADGFAIKSLIQGLGGAFVLLLAGVGWVFSKESESDPAARPVEAQDARIGPERMSPILGAQLLLLLGLAWSFLATQWSNAPTYAFGGAVLFALGILWAFGLGVGLGRRGAEMVGRGLVWISTPVAALAIWYHFERRPDRAVGYPIGLPHVFAACMLPALVITWSCWYTLVRTTLRRMKCEWVRLVGLTVAGVVLGWAIYLSHSVTAYLGLAVGASVLVYHAFRQSWRVFVLAGLLAVVAGSGWVALFSADHRAGLDGAGHRARLYAWEYATQIIRLRPVSGTGPGGYALLANNLVAEDIIHDPEAFGSGLLGHARSEWLETMCELGGTGLAVVGGAYVLTILGAVRISRRQWDPNIRAMVVGAAAGLTGMMVEMGLSDSARHPIHPIVFFTLVGIIWASGKEEGISRLGPLKHKTWVRGTVLTGVLVLSLGGALLSAQDWNTARAQMSIPHYLKTYDFERGLAIAEQVHAGQLDPRRKLGAGFDKILLYATWAQRLLDNGHRRNGSGTSQAPAGLARRDFEQAIRVADLGLQEVLRLEGTCPSYVGIGWQWCNLAEIREQASNALSPQMGPPTYPPRAYAALVREYQRNPFTPSVALRLWSLPPTQNQSLSQQLNVLGPCIRAGRFDEGLHNAVNQLSQRDGFDDALATILKSADRARPDRPGDGQADGYATEMQWIAAAVMQGRGRFAEAAELLQRSLHASESLDARFPYRRSAMEFDLATVLFLMNPQAPGAALAVAEAALDHLPVRAEATAQRHRIVSLLVGLHLAQDSEPSAVKWIQQDADVPLNAEATNRRLADGYLQISRQVMGAGAKENRSAIARQWLDRAAELDHGNGETYWLMGLLAIETEDGERVVAALSGLSREDENAQAVRQLIAQALARLPNDEHLSRWLTDHPKWRPPPAAATQPQR